MKKQFIAHHFESGNKKRNLLKSLGLPFTGTTEELDLRIEKLTYKQLKSHVNN